MTVMILGVLSTTLSGAAAVFLVGICLLAALLVQRIGARGSKRPLPIVQTIRLPWRTGRPTEANTGCLNMASRAPPPEAAGPGELSHGPGPDPHS